MSTAAPVDTDLHLPELRIKGFRGIRDLHISRLGRVTLVAGRNGTGKTTALEAVKVYAARGRYAVLADLLYDREETVLVFDESVGGETLQPSWQGLFYERQSPPTLPIHIGPSRGPGLGIETRLTNVQQDPFSKSRLIPVEGLIRVHFGEFLHEFPWVYSERRTFGQPTIIQPELPLVVPCELLGPDLPSSLQLAGFWDRVALTDEESRAVKALNLIYSNSVERVAMIGDDTGDYRGTGRRPVVKLRDEPRPVPLKSLGDGAVRLFGVALVLANSKDGLLLIDEAENGIHHSIQRDFWTMILKAAHQNNVQVLATTHSWDCVAGFAMAATEIEEVDGALVRLDRYDDYIRAVEYTEDDLRVAAKHGIEVR